MSRNSVKTLQAAKLFDKREERLREGRKAMAEYEAAGRAMREKIARLRALRLARDADDDRTPACEATCQDRFASGDIGNPEEK